MIELANIKATNTVGQLRGQINAMQNEIMADQPMIGTAVNPSINYYAASKISISGSGTMWEDAALIGTSTASQVSSNLVFLCFPENNGVFIANVWGAISLTAEPTFTGSSTVFRFAVVDIPAIKIATRDSTIATFVTCEHIGLPASANITNLLTGVVNKPIMQLRGAGGTDMLGNNTRGLYIEQGDNTCNLIYDSMVIN